MNKIRLCFVTRTLLTLDEEEKNSSEDLRLMVSPLSHFWNNFSRAYYAQTPNFRN